MDTSTVRLSAQRGSPLDDPRVRSTVEATARAILERTGVPLRGLASDGASLTVTIEADKIAAMGFLAELRRLTNAWYEGKFKAGTLWGPDPERPPPDGPLDP